MLELTVKKKKKPIRETCLDDIQGLRGPQEVNLDSLEPIFGAHVRHSKKSLLISQLQSGTPDSVPQGAVVHAFHIPHHMTQVLGHGQGD